MSKTVMSLIQEAEAKWDMWRDIACDSQALSDRNKTREQAIILASFFEGRFDGLCDALNLNANKKGE